MMGHKGTLKGGSEWDALTRWKKVLHWNPGERKLIKRKYNKRQRKMWRSGSFQTRSEAQKGLPELQTKEID